MQVLKHDYFSSCWDISWILAEITHSLTCNRNVKVSIVKKKSTISITMFQLLWNCLSKYVQMAKKKKRANIFIILYRLRINVNSRLNSIRNSWHSSSHHICSKGWDGLHILYLMVPVVVSKNFLDKNFVCVQLESKQSFSSR